jgi:predicted Rossmann fold flavoprotein
LYLSALIQYLNLLMNIIIIGGGAAGFFAAIACAEANPEASITILERGKEVLQKVKISGGGRCNVTHACFVPRELVKSYPRGDKALMSPFSRFCTGDTIDWFEKRGVELKVEDDGRMFPVTDNSMTIVNCLWRGAIDAGVKILLHIRVMAIAPHIGGGFDLRTPLETFRADKVLVATGSSTAVWDLLSDIGHKIVPPVPSLFTFNIKNPILTDLAGLSVPNAQVKVLGSKLQSIGPLLITHWGVSGPGILRLSSWGAVELAALQYQFDLSVNWLGVYNTEEAKEHLMECKLEHNKKHIINTTQYEIPSRLWKRLVAASGIADELRWADASKKDIQALASQLTACVLKVNGKSTFKDEFVTAGGVELNEVNFKTYESKLHSGLYFAGEVLNIDAITGGFNFQAAWTGGWIAGKAMALADTESVET